MAVRNEEIIGFLLSSEIPSISESIIFSGSRSRGAHCKGIDLDILIIVESEPAISAVRKLLRTIDLQSKFPDIPLDIRIVSRKEFAKAYASSEHFAICTFLHRGIVQYGCNLRSEYPLQGRFLRLSMNEALDEFYEALNKLKLKSQFVEGIVLLMGSLKTFSNADLLLIQRNFTKHAMSVVEELLGACGKPVHELYNRIRKMKGKQIGVFGRVVRLRRTDTVLSKVLGQPDTLSEVLSRLEMYCKRVYRDLKIRIDSDKLDRFICDSS